MIAGRLRKAFGDHVYRRSVSVIVERRAGAGRTGNPDAKPDWLTFAVLRDGDPLPPLDAWLARRAEDFAGMLRAGKLAVFALEHGVAVGCVWVSFTDHDDARLGERYAVGPGEAYHYCWLIVPRMRRTNVGMPLSRFVVHRLEAMGIDRCFGVVDRENRASYLIQQHFGYRECGRMVLHYHLFGHYWTRYRTYDGTLGPVKTR